MVNRVIIQRPPMNAIPYLHGRNVWPREGTLAHGRWRQTLHKDAVRVVDMGVPAPLSRQGIQAPVIQAYLRHLVNKLMITLFATCLAVATVIFATLDVDRFVRDGNSYVHPTLGIFLICAGFLLLLVAVVSTLTIRMYLDRVVSRFEG